MHPPDLVPRKYTVHFGSVSGDGSMSVYVDSSTSFILFRLYLCLVTEWIALMGLVRALLLPLCWVQKRLL